jgi:transposase
MLGFGTATRIYLAVGATDMRKGFDGLYGLVKQRLEADPLSGHLFLFCNRPRTRLKVLFWDGSGLWVCAKRLEKGSFSWPREAGEGVKAVISNEELALLLGGIDLAKTRRKNWWRHEPLRGGQNSGKDEENTG